MTRWYPLEAADLEFFASAPHVFRYAKHFAARPDEVWDSLTSDTSIATWTNTVKAVTWTSPRPFEVGTTREVAGPAGSLMRERYFHWEEGRRHSFYVYESTLPVFQRFAEDYVVEPDGAGTVFTWTVAIEPKPALTLPAKVLAPAFKFGFGRMPSDGRRYFAKR